MNSPPTQDNQTTQQQPDHADLICAPLPLGATTASSVDNSDRNATLHMSRGNEGEDGLLRASELRPRGDPVDPDDNHTATPHHADAYLPTPTPTSPVPEDSHIGAGLFTGGDAIMGTSEALRPDPNTEAEFEVENNKFAFSPGQMSKLLKDKNLSIFYALGGLTGLERGLRTNRHSGLSSDETILDGNVSLGDVKRVPTDVHITKPAIALTAKITHSLSRRHSHELFADRKRVFKDNYLPTTKPRNIFRLMWMAYNDKILIFLTVVAVISLGVGLYQTFGLAPTPTEPAIEWVEGVAIIVAIVIIVIVGAVNDFEKERQFSKLNEKTKDRSVKVTRSGKAQEIPVSDVLVGDVVHLITGDVIPADGVFISGYHVRCDESSETGESDLIRKCPAEDVFEAIKAHQDLSEMDPFIISGAKVAEGIGTYLVTSTGINSCYGRTLLSLRKDPEVTPLQSKLEIVAGQIAKLGGVVALVLFVVLFIEFLARLPHSTQSPAQKGHTFLNILIIVLIVAVIAVPEGLPLAVTLALAFATTRMLKDNNLVRRLKACETMGNATTICSDKTGTLTQNKMMVVCGIVGKSSPFTSRKEHSSALPSPNTMASEKTRAPSNNEVVDVSTSEFVGNLAKEVKILLEQSIVINSTAFEGVTDDGQQTFIGSRTETALLAFARDYLGMAVVSIERSNSQIAQLIPFDSSRKYMATIVKLHTGKYRLYAKGASEVLLAKCTRIIQDPTKEVSDMTLAADAEEYLEQAITTYSARSLRTIGLFYRDFEQWPPTGARTTEGDKTQALPDDVLTDLVFLGVVGIQDPLRDGVQKAVQTCQEAGVFVRMVTGDNVFTAKTIATECGILTPDGVVMEGPEFRTLSMPEIDDIIPRLQVLARSSPEDKRILVERLKALGETVAVTGDGTNDALALMTADVGFSMGIEGTEVAKEASSIVLLDDNFASIIKAIMWGRTVNDAVKKFLQFQITVSITTVGLTFVSAVANSKGESVLTAVQLLWVNLIQDTLAALALATDPPAPGILNRKPDPKSAPLITITMWKMIVGQSIYQLAVTLILYFAGSGILSYHSNQQHGQLETVIFNAFVWMQIFNQYNNRRLDNKFNIFEGISRNWFFIAISLIMISCQVMIVFVGGASFAVTRLNGAQWGYSIILGALSIPVGVVIRIIPDKLFEKMSFKSLIPKMRPGRAVADEEA